MTREEIEKELKDIEDREFWLAMVDRWSDSDYDYSRKLHDRKRELEVMLNA